MSLAVAAEQTTAEEQGWCNFPVFGSSKNLLCSLAAQIVWCLGSMNHSFRAVGSCRHQTGFARDVEGEMKTTQPAWVSEGLGKCLSNPGEEKDGNCLPFPSIQFFWLYHITEVITVTKQNPYTASRNIFSGLSYWDRFAPSKNPKKAAFLEAKCCSLVYLESAWAVLWQGKLMCCSDTVCPLPYCLPMPLPMPKGLVELYAQSSVTASVFLIRVDLWPLDLYVLLHR